MTKYIDRSYTSVLNDTPDPIQVSWQKCVDEAWIDVLSSEEEVYPEDEGAQMPWQPDQWHKVCIQVADDADPICQARYAPALEGTSTTLMASEILGEGSRRAKSEAEIPIIPKWMWGNVTIADDVTKQFPQKRRKMTKEEKERPIIIDGPSTVARRPGQEQVNWVTGALPTWKAEMPLPGQEIDGGMPVDPEIAPPRRPSWLKSGTPMGLFSRDTPNSVRFASGTTPPPVSLELYTLGKHRKPYSVISGLIASTCLVLVFIGFFKFRSFRQPVRGVRNCWMHMRTEGLCDPLLHAN